MSKSESHTESNYVDKLAYAVSLLDGAERIASTARGKHIGTIGIPFYLLIGFSIENGLKAFLNQRRTPGKWHLSHKLGDLLTKAIADGLILNPGVEAMIRHLSRYHEEFWFRYPEKANVPANLYSSDTMLIVTDALLRSIFRLTGTEFQLFHDRDRTNPDDPG